MNNPSTIPPLYKNSPLITMIKSQPLTPEEHRVIIEKGTERPGTGELLYEKRKGTYLCRQCHSPLYES